MLYWLFHIVSGVSEAMAMGLVCFWPPEPSSDETHCFDLQERERRMEYVPERSEAASNRIYTGASKSR